MTDLGFTLKASTLLKLKGCLTQLCMVIPVVLNVIDIQNTGNYKVTTGNYTNTGNYKMQRYSRLQVATIWMQAQLSL